MAAYFADAIWKTKEPGTEDEKSNQKGAAGTGIDGQSLSDATGAPNDLEKPKKKKKFIIRLRFGAIFPLICAIIAFSLKLTFILAGSDPNSLQGDFLFEINATRVGQDVVQFQRVTDTTSTAAPPSGSASTAAAPDNPLGQLNPFSPSSPLNPANPNNPLNQLTAPLIDNITDRFNADAQDMVNDFIATIVKQSGIQPQYRLFIDSICAGNETIDRCAPYNDGKGLTTSAPPVPSFFIVGQTNITVPIIGQLTKSFIALNSLLNTVRTVSFATLIASLVVTGLSAFSSFLGIFFGYSQVLIFFNLMYPFFATLSHFLCAVVVTIIIVGVGQAAEDFGEQIGVVVKRGTETLVLVWLSWLFSAMALTYWLVVWFVELRTWALVKRTRTDEQRANYRGVRKEVCDDLKGRSPRDESPSEIPRSESPREFTVRDV